MGPEQQPKQPAPEPLLQPLQPLQLPQSELKPAVASGIAVGLPADVLPLTPPTKLSPILVKGEHSPKSYMSSAARKENILSPIVSEGVPLATPLGVLPVGE